MEKEAKDDPNRTSRLLMGPEQVTRPKTLQARIYIMTLKLWYMQESTGAFFIRSDVLTVVRSIIVSPEKRHRVVQKASTNDIMEHTQDRSDAGVFLQNTATQLQDQAVS
jgi:hypothetical protein